MSSKNRRSARAALDFSGGCSTRGKNPAAFACGAISEAPLRNFAEQISPSSGVRSGINELTFESLATGGRSFSAVPGPADVLQSGPPQTHLTKDSFKVSQDLLSLPLSLISSCTPPPHPPLKKKVKSQSSRELSQRRRGGETCLAQQSWKNRGCRS